MTTAEKAKEAVLERVIELAKDATMLDLFHLTDAIEKMTGENTQNLATVPELLLNIMKAAPNFGEIKNKGDKK